MGHSPGPWRSEGWEGVVVNTAEGVTIALCPSDGPHCPLERIKANARLIAAAPEMLTALESIRAVLSIYADRSNGAVKRCIDITRTAIAKAKGESDATLGTT